MGSEVEGPGGVDVGGSPSREGGMGGLRPDYLMYHMVFYAFAFNMIVQ